MNKNGKSLFIKIFGTTAAALIAASGTLPGSVLASEADNAAQLPPLQITDSAPMGLPKVPGALTSPPPPEPAQNSMQNLADNKYLKDYFSSISASGSSSVYVTASSSGSSIATQVGVTATVQRWTGSSWVDVGSPTASSSSASSSSLSFSRVVTKGYYYRVKSEHWASGGGNRESSSLYSGTALVK